MATPELLPGDSERVAVAKEKLTLALRAVDAGDVPANFDLKNAFLVYASVSGDADKAAMALDISRVAIERLIIEEGWDARIEGLIRLRKSGNGRLVEKGLNRALNFTQAQRFRMVLERLMRRLSEMTDDELMEYSFQTETSTHKDGTVDETKRFNARPFADLASAMEKCHSLSYMALCDTSGERKKREDEHAGPTEAEIHSTIAGAIAKMNTPAAGPTGTAVDTLSLK
jgi:hypothetical protein